MSKLYDGLAAAYVRGMLPDLRNETDLRTLVTAAEVAGLKLHRFKRTQELPRVRAILGILRSLTPGTLLDVGSGRGVFLWPVLNAFPTLEVTCVEVDPARATHLRAVQAGGIDRLEVLELDAASTGLAANSFDIVTVLEVLEHLEKPAEVAREAVRLASQFLLVSVPSKFDDNPAHIHLFTKGSMAELLKAAGATSVKFEYVLNHMIAIAKI